MEKESTIQRKALEIALTQVGVQEIGNTNTGPQVNEYLKCTGLPPGFPWCAAFVYWCYLQAANELKVKTPLNRTAGVLKQWDHQPPLRKILAGDAIKNITLIKPGSIFVMDFGGGKGHMGLTRKAYGGYIDTVEGNSNDEGLREGKEVCELGRKIITLKGFLVFE